MGRRLSKSELARRVCERLARLYGAENLNNKADPTDEYFFLVLSTKTSHRCYEEGYEALKRAVGEWNNLLEVPESRLKEILAPCGLAELKAKWIKRAALIMARRFGEVTLEPLRDWPDEEAEAFLRSLPGVGPKVAKAIMMYSLGKDVLPVDTHTYRLAFRLGLTEEVANLRNEKGKLHIALEAAIPKGCRRAFHVGAIVLGRKYCRPRQPICAECPLNDICPKRGVEPSLPRARTADQTRLPP